MKTTKDSVVFNNIKSFYGFSTSEFLSVVGSVVLILGISIPIVAHKLSDQKIGVALRQTQDVAVKYNSEFMSKLEKQVLASNSNGGPVGDGSAKNPTASSPTAAVPSRSIASVSESKFEVREVDPWGHALNVRPLKNAYGQITRVLVWSNGPNGKSDTTESQIETLHQRQVLDFAFGGDDIGIVKSVR